jgi:hypothetical protein
MRRGHCGWKTAAARPVCRRKHTPTARRKKVANAHGAIGRCGIAHRCWTGLSGSKTPGEGHPLLESGSLAGYARKKKWSRPISRVLSWTVIHLGRASPHASSDQPGSGAGHTVAPLFGLAPGGVYRAADVTTGAVRSYRTFSPLPPSYLWIPPGPRGGAFAVLHLIRTGCIQG